MPVECFGGFVFLNPDPDAAPLADFLGEIAGLLAPYHMEEMVPVGFNTREVLDCNWKVVMDAFQEGYHIQGVHPELVSAMDESKERYAFFGDHSVATGPFGAANLEDFGPEAQAEVDPRPARDIPRRRRSAAALRGIAQWLSRRGWRVDLYRGRHRTFATPAGDRDTLTGKGLDVSGLTDIQMSDNHFHLVFPNLFITIRAGEATVIISTPHPDGDPNRCYLARDHADVAAARSARGGAGAADRDRRQGGPRPLFHRAGAGLRPDAAPAGGAAQQALPFMALTRQEVRLAYFHSVLDSWV